MLYAKKRKNNSKPGKTRSLTWFDNKHTMQQRGRQFKSYRSKCGIGRRTNFSKRSSKSMTPLKVSLLRKLQRVSKGGNKLNSKWLKNNYPKRCGVKQYVKLRSSLSNGGQMNWRTPNSRFRRFLAK